MHPGTRLRGCADICDRLHPQIEWRTVCRILTGWSHLAPAPWDSALHVCDVVTGVSIPGLKRHTRQSHILAVSGIHSCLQSRTLLLLHQPSDGYHMASAAEAHTACIWGDIN